METITRNGGRLWSRKQLSELLGITPNGLDSLVKRGDFPAPDVRLGRRLVRWTDRAVQSYIQSGGTH